MTIYAAAITSKGKNFYRSDKIQTLSLRRLVMLGVLQGDGWHTLEKIAERVERVYQEADRKTQYDLYEGWRTSEILRDLFDLKRLEYVTLATYKSRFGQLFEYKPHGMQFVVKD